MQPLKKKKKKKEGPGGGGGELLIHSNLELYILHTYVHSLCGAVHLLEFDQKHTHTKERTEEEDNGKRKRKKVIKKKREVK